MDLNKDKQVSKQPYEKPHLRIIELAAEEVLAGGCKTDGGASQLGPGPLCGQNGCATIGTS